jgi:hypothetical protein
MAAFTLHTSPPEPSAQVLWSTKAVRAIGGGDFGAPAYWRRVVGETFRPAMNLNGRAGWVSHGAFGCPITVHDRRRTDSYPVSLMTQYLDYPRAELNHFSSGPLRLAARLGLVAFEAILRGAMADRTVQWNSWMFSTNPVPEGLLGSVGAITRSLVREFPEHAVVLRNVDEVGAPGLADQLVQQGYRLLTSRIVHCFDARQRPLRGTSTLRRDGKEFAGDTRYRWVHPSEILDSDAARIAELYRMLYLDKHSRLNPHYDEAFVRAAIRDRWLEFHGLRDRLGRLVGIWGYFTIDHTITTVPFIGYDTALPAESGLYRQLFLGLHREVNDRKQLLNYSSGAGEFKRRRGAVPAVEYNAVFDRHLPERRRMGFRIAGLLLNRLARPWLEASGL